MTAPVVEAHCCECHHVVNIPTGQVSLLCAGGVTTYGFECPRCHAHVIRVASTSVLAAFARGGVKPRLVPLSRPEIAGQPPSGPPINYDDVLDFGLAIEATV